jgi:hypothetical protein
MAKWRVYNRHKEGLTHVEKFRDETITIKAGEYVTMDYEDAVRFRGQYFPMLKDAQGAEDPKGWKMIHLEPDTDAPEVTTATQFICHFDGEKFASQAHLDAWIKANYSDDIVKDDELDRQIAVEKARGRGRQAKEKSA